jgi:hypothetical protein
MAGRTTEARTISAVNKTNASTAITAAAGSFDKSDVGRAITGTGIQASTTIAAVASGTAATLSQNANATNSAAATIAADSTVSPVLGFIGWSPESQDEANSYTVTAVNAGTPVPPDRITGTTTQQVTGRRVRT